MTDEEKKDLKTEQARERLVRWEAHRRDMLTNSINIVFGLATGLLGFVANINHEPKTWDSIWWVFLLLGISILFAIGAGFSRFWSFRHVADLNRLEYNDLLNGTDRSSKVEEHRSLSTNWDMYGGILVLTKQSLCISFVSNYKVLVGMEEKS